MTQIYLNNTLSRRKELFEPIDPQNVRMYVCGPTVYDRAHLGNGKTPVSYDVLYRLLCYVYGKDHVTYVSNITDVDDKILNKHKEKVENSDILKEYKKEYKKIYGRHYSHPKKFTEKQFKQWSKRATELRDSYDDSQIDEFKIELQKLNDQYYK